MARKTQDQLADSGTIVQETFSGISIVKAFTSEFHEITRYVKSLKAVVTTTAAGVVHVRRIPMKLATGVAQTF